LPGQQLSCTYNPRIAQIAEMDTSSSATVHLSAARNKVHVYEAHDSDMHESKFSKFSKFD
jgi:hypothetical protein